MIRNKGNTYNKVLRHLKSTQIDEKIQLLSEVPTNSTSGIYVIEPESIVQDPDETVLEGEADFTQDTLANGRDTTGLFLEDGTILTIEPPDALGNKSFILGPMASMWYAWGNFSTIGYIRQSDRRMVDLGRITGPLGSWNGSSNFTSYGQLTLAQAVWFRDTPKLNGANNDTPNYRAFYPGPPSNAPDQYGRYYCVITGTPKPTTRTPPPRRVPPVVGNPNQAGYPSWGNTRGKGGGSKGSKGGGPKTPGPKIVGPKIVGPKPNKKDTVVEKLFNEIQRAFKILGSGGNAVDAKSYNTQLASNLFSSIISGKSLSITLDKIAKSDMIKNVNLNNFAKSLEIGKAPNPTSYNATNPGNKKNVLTGEWGSQGGSEVHYNPKTDTLTITSNKMLRTGEPGDKFDMGRQTSFGDIPPPNPKVVQQKVTQLLTHPAIDSFLSGLGYATNISTGQIQAVYPTNLNQINLNQQAKNPWDLIKNDSDALKNFNKSLSSAATDIATGAVQGTASNAVAIRQVLTNLGVPKSGQEEGGGGYGHVYSQTSYNGKEIPQNLRNIINNKLEENILYEPQGQVLSENRRRILREIKKPYVLPEIPKQKYKFDFSNKYRTINPDLMKKAEVPTSFKPAEEKLWGKYEKDKNSRMSQERKNEVLDHLGGSDHAWEYMTETSREKNNKIMYGNFDNKKELKVVRKEELKGDTLLFILDETNKKESILQSELSIQIANEYNKELFQKYFQEQETMQADKDPLFKRVSKRLKKEIDYADKPAKNGYPNDPPPEMVNGWNPEYGKDKGYYNKLDPQSAKAMPPTGNPEIDKRVKKARKQPK